MFDGFGIDGNREVFDQLVDLLRTGEAIGFVGAGASAPLYPLWNGLIERLAERAVVTRRADDRTRDYWCRQAGDRPDHIAQQIRRALDTGDYAQAMRELFGPKGEGDRFTAAHGVLVQLPFQGFVTTNYDPCLDEAVAELAPGRRPQTFTWRDDRVALWRREEPAGPRELPILHAHGRFDVVDSIVLGIDEYRTVYGDAHPYLDLLGHLFTRERLVFVGFSFADRWLTSFVDRVVTRAGVRRVESPRHVAVLGLPGEERDDADHHARGLGEALRARVLFYPVESGDHSQLGVLLAKLHDGVAGGGAADSAAAAPAAVAAADPLDAWFEHVELCHRHLEDHFGALGRPAKLNLLEEAWVEIQLQPDLERLEQGAAERAKGSLAGRRLTLEQALALGAGDAPWITGSWLLEGPPGSGKTTLLRHFARTLAKCCDRGRIPLFVSLPRLVDPAAGEGILGLATAALRLTGAAGVERHLEAACRDGRVVVLLDGLDEVPPERRPVVEALLAQLRRDWAGCPLVVSSRPLGRGALPPGFPRLELMPLDEARRRAFLITWFTHAGHGDADAEADDALACFARTRGLGKLAGNPLYLTLLALLWLRGSRPERLSRLYDEVFDLLLGGKHKPAPGPIQARAQVRQALVHLAYGMTEDDRWAEPVTELEARLRRPELEAVRRGLESVGRWRDRLDRFLDDVYERTQILGPHDGRGGDWRFWHRTFREALTAERLGELYASGGVGALAALGGGGNAGDGPDEGRWAEPLALFAGRLEAPDALVEQLAQANLGLALRAMVFTEGLEPATLVRTLGLAYELDERAQVFERVPTQLGDAEACLELVERLKESGPSAFDFFWLDWILARVAELWPGFAAASRAARERLFERLPQPDPGLFLPPGGGLWCTIPEGEGWIGSPDDEKGRHGDEGPRHRVTVESPFALAATPVTRAQYAAFDARQDAGERPDHPVTELTWYEAVAFCRWLAQLPELAGARLPTEEEWEYACRAGTGTRYWSGDDEADLARVGWYDKNSKGQTHEVGGKPANDFGLFDMHGNVREWTASQWKDDYSGQAGGLTVDPAADTEDLAEPRAWRVVRGGCFVNTADWARSAYRGNGDPRNRWGDQGFRVLLPRPPAGRR